VEEKENHRTTQNKEAKKERGVRKQTVKTKAPQSENHRRRGVVSTTDMMTYQSFSSQHQNANSSDATHQNTAITSFYYWRV
jgi:hypothetical protein